MPKSAASTASSASVKVKPAPKAVLDKIVLAIRESPPGPTGGVSRVTIAKYLKSEFDYDNANQIKSGLKRGVSNGTLRQLGQSFSVATDKPRVASASGEPLKMEDVKKGKGDSSELGDTVTVEYVGKLEDQTTFDSAKSFEFTLGAGDVIKGWDQGLIGVAVGGKRKLVVPSHLGYGKRGCAPDIPPNATLYFEVTMKKITKS
jgi:FKBP-type peptidyl-prolyl cis-trans isomerase